MKKKIFLALAVLAMLVCVFAISVSAASTTGNIDYKETVKLTDGTVLPIYDENQNPLIWFISGTNESGANIYSSIPATQTTADENGNVVSYSGNDSTYTDAYGSKHSYFNCTGLTIKYKIGENEDGSAIMLTVNNVNNNSHNNLVVVANLRGVDKNIGDVQGGAFRSNVEYMFLPETMLKSGDWRQTHCKVVDLTQSANLRQIINQSFKIPNYIEDVRMPTITPIYDDNGVLTNPLTIEGYAFQGCNKLTSLEIPKTLYSVGNNAFQGCKALTTIGDVPNLTIINADAFENCFALTGLDFKSTKLTSIGARAFRYAGLQDEIEFPSTLTSIGDNAFYQLKLTKSITLSSNLEALGSQVFRQITTLEYFDFNGATLETMGDYFFFNNSSLRAVSLPEGLKNLGTRPFEGCSKLEAVYLPDSLTILPYLQNIKNLYFVNDSFSIDWENGIFDSADWNGQKPKKPEIYYMPTSLVSVQETGLHSCTGINNTVVFPEGLTQVTHQYTFFAIPDRNFVFLGEVTLLNVNSTQRSNYYFINDNVTAENLTIEGNGSHNLYFHSAGAHLCEKSIISNPDCVTNSFEKQICFCNAEIQTIELENTLLGHSHTVFIDLVYADYSADGYYSYQCERCDDVNNNKVAPALFTNLGYSAAEYGEGAMSINYKVNEDAITEYEKITGKSVNYGVFAVLASNIGDKELFDENGASQQGVIAADITDSGFTLFSLKIVGFTEEQKEIDLAMGAFVGTAKDDTTEYSYLQIGEPTNGKYFFASYNDVLAMLPKENEVA